MNSDAEAKKNLLAWLLRDPDQTVKAPSGDISSLGSPDESVGDPLLNYLDPLDSEDVGLLPASLGQSNHFSFGERSFFELGDKPAVQDRFHTLLKRRLRAEIERNPPRFPWETGAYHYGAEPQNGMAPDRVPAYFWTAQLQKLDLPIALPEAVLTSLFEQCQTLVQSSLREGAKLVQAVESLFPGESQALNHLAGLVLASPVRSGTLAPSLREAEGLPNHYEMATPAQQMAVSLMAAREILESLTLTVSPDIAPQPLRDRPNRTQQWATAAGTLALAIDYQAQQLRIQAQFPCKGLLRQGQNAAQRDDAGNLTLEFPAPEGTYALEVQLAEQPPLVFAVRVAASDS